MATFTIYLDKKYINGRLQDFKLKTQKNPWGKGMVWYVLFEDGSEYNTILAASGRERFYRRSIAVKYKEESNE